MFTELGEVTMSNIIVYQGSTEKVEHPICALGRPNLDFGQGFYVTNLREQALLWANHISKNRNKPALLNRYLLNQKFKKCKHAFNLKFKKKDYNG